MKKKIKLDAESKEVLSSLVERFSLSWDEVVELAVVAALSRGLKPLKCSGKTSTLSVTVRDSLAKAVKNFSGHVRAGLMFLVGRYDSGLTAACRFSDIGNQTTGCLHGGLRP